MKKISTSLLVGASVLASSMSFAAEEVNVYSYRQPFLVEPMMEEFTAETGIKVNVLFAKKGLIERIKREGKLSTADIMLTSDFSRLALFTEDGLAQSVNSDVLNKNIPSKFHGEDEQWFALTSRARSIYSSVDRVGPVPDITYQDLATPAFKGKVCMRSGKHPYNVSLLASIIAHEGEAKAKEWLEGLKANLARKPQGNDRAQVKAVKEGLCDYALTNSYYLGKMLNDPKQVSWAEAVHINFPNQKTTGTHVNISGVAVTKYAPNKENAIKLIEFLSGDVAQGMYAEINFEYPVKVDVKPSELVSSWGEFKQDDLKLADIAAQHEAAIKMMDEVKFDL
ncbi:Fe(3+) ABC transporter substrate-binding protein [Psychromonas aquatilis]|uniref:Fe(3+) ABC transporter substrate-binding protein n=1 Tax=Psychromonas aquatilis TaxID=2005072 RepID=UPI003C7501EC